MIIEKNEVKLITVTPNSHKALSIGTRHCFKSYINIVFVHICVCIYVYVYMNMHVNIYTYIFKLFPSQKFYEVGTIIICISQVRKQRQRRFK